METILVLSTTLVAVLTLVLGIVINLVWLRPKKLERNLRNQDFKGNFYRWMNGDQLEMSEMTKSALSSHIPSASDHNIVPRIMPYFHHIVKKYGIKSFIWYGRRPRINVVEPEMIREIFSKWEIFHKERPGNVVPFGLVTREEEDWTKMRRILNPAFHVAKLKGMYPVMKQSVKEMLAKWDEKVGEKGSGEVDVWDYLNALSADVIAKTAFGTSYEEGLRLFKLQEKKMMLIFQQIRSPLYFIPGSSYMPTEVNRKKNQVEQEIQTLVKDLIDRRKKSLRTGNYQYKDDLLGIMVESNEKEVEEHGSGMTNDDVVMECQLFLLAGKDTTAALLTWAMVLLSQYQEWQTKAREEVLQYLGKDRTPEFEDLNHLKVVTMILNETLRFYPLVTTLTRVVHRDLKLNKLPLLRGTECNLPTIIVHRDPKIWGKDANEFNPSRFSEGVANATNVAGSFFPFGGGPRVCIGQNFALAEAKLALAKIVQNFSFELSPNYVHAPECLVSLQPQFGTPLILHKIDLSLN